MTRKNFFIEIRKLLSRVVVIACEMLVSNRGQQSAILYNDQEFMQHTYTDIHRIFYPCYNESFNYIPGSADVWFFSLSYVQPWLHFSLFQATA